MNPGSPHEGRLLETPRAVRTLVLALGAVAVAFGVARGAPALEAHARLRDAWMQEREKAGGPGYDATRSDRLYAASREAHERAGDGARWLALGLIAFSLSRRRSPPTASRGLEHGDGLERGAGLEQSVRGRFGGRIALASLADLGLATLGLAALGLDVAESASLHALQRAATLLGPGLVWAGLATGRSPGLALASLSVAPHPLRAAIATFALPLAALAPLLWLAGRMPGIHLRLAGLAPRGAGSPPRG